MPKKQHKHFITNQELLSRLRNQSVALLHRNSSLQITNQNYGLIPNKQNTHKSNLNTLKTTLQGKSLNYSSNRHSAQKNEHSNHKETKSKNVSQLQTTVSVNNFNISSANLYQSTKMYQEAQESHGKHQVMYSHVQIMTIIRNLAQQFSKPQLILSFQQKLKRLSALKPRNSLSKFDIQETELTSVYNPSKIEAELMQKIEQLYKDKSKLKNQKKLLQQQLKMNTISENNLEYDKLVAEKWKLQKIITKQTQVINLKAHENSDQLEDMRKIMFAQAKGLELTLRKLR